MMTSAVDDFLTNRIQAVNGKSVVDRQKNYI